MIEVKVKDCVADKLKLPVVKVSLGCGLHWKQPFEEWINQDAVENEHTDIVCTWDSIPLPDKCADFIEMGDIWEHVHLYDRDRIFKEWFRILKVGGKIRVSTPNLHRTMVAYANKEITLENAIQNLYAWMTNEYESHYYTYTQETLRDTLIQYGFTDIDFSESPGVDGNSDKSMSWWLVCGATLERHV